MYWVANLVTDRNGEARVQVTYPDALTTWRVTARGATVDTRVGQAIGRTTVTKDLIARVITPRFLAQGDEDDTVELALAGIVGGVGACADEQESCGETG